MPPTNPSNEHVNQKLPRLYGLMGPKGLSTLVVPEQGPAFEVPDDPAAVDEPATAPATVDSSLPQGYRTGWVNHWYKSARANKAAS